MFTNEHRTDVPAERGAAPAPLLAALPAAAVTAVRLRLFRSPVRDGVAMSFAPMTHRSMAVVVVELADGHCGLGETWVNYPSWAWRERVATVEEGITPLAVGRMFETPQQAHDLLVGSLAPLGRQWGAPGPMYQAISGFDAALWDIAAQHAGTSLARLLSGMDASSAEAALPAELPVYASSLGPHDVASTAEACLAAGHNAVKVKVGFGRDVDMANLATARRVLGDEVQLFADANQAWSLDEATAMIPALLDVGVGWLEEPLRGDSATELAELRRRGGLPLATGENIYGAGAFAPYLDVAAVDIVQPDLSKVGGPTEYQRVSALASRTGTTVNPHLYNGTVATAATVQVAVATPSTTAVEWDVRRNPLRAIVDDLLTEHGTVRVPQGPGLGLDIDLEALMDMEEKL